ncbi:uncharacterized protein BX663DRAFT_494597 [Cokeromyces recurvatus]|uniref:uncharacterized protein n=1 Tax=Cokeromyces recurvatus TaxID=90255 RepID=UPI0022201C9E|nr:uncharacterized protein BX663DRAFT_494597 [Cokeromyces recurvatus]KAI7907035.1 hypothetical protein BX663DRAFT_494597 [Cokeromyces recurvatus]
MHCSFFLFETHTHIYIYIQLLGNECHDLDIAINDMMGYEFATYVNKYLESQGVPTKSIAKIESNPDKSKHLETATTRIFNQEVDFCNLRTEIYEEGSRIPTQITFGTPEEDAYRRDITINSLFYNVNTRSVEDFTGKGIPDLINGLIRTPLEPFETFRDDPLRVIRCIRFSSRFNFEMVPELCKAAKHTEIKNALINKISRERIGIEFDKMIKGPHPLLSLQLIHQLELYPIIMAPPENIKSGTIDNPIVAVKAVGIVQWLFLNNHPYYRHLMPVSENERRTLVLAASVLPYLNVVSEVKKKEIPTVQLVLRDSIKTTNADMNTVSTIFRGLKGIQDLANNNKKETVKRSELGMLIRDLGALWQTAVKLAIVKECLDTYPEVAWTHLKEVHLETGKEICEKYNALIEQANQYGISECYTWKHIVDGKTAAHIVGVKPGPVVSELLTVQMKWQLEHPEGTKEECEQAIKAYWENK